MAVKAKSAFGTVLKISSMATTPVFTAIPGIRNLQGPAMDMEIMDATHHASPGSSREKVASFKDPGNVTFDLLLDSTDGQQEALIDAHVSQDLTDFEQILTDRGAMQLAYSAFVKSINPAMPIDDVLAVAVTLECSGEVVIT